MIIVPLTKGKSAIIDDADADKIKGYKWSAALCGKKFYARAPVIGTKKLIYMHQVIMPVPDGMQTDHKDGDGLNNTRDNLRPCTPSQNRMNIERRSHNTSGFKGVVRRKRLHPWMARITVGGKIIYLGQFSTAIEAAKAYNEASLKYHGEFGYRNLIP